MYFKIPTYRNKTAGNVLQESNVVRCVRVLDARTASGQRKQITVLTLDRWADELPAHALEVLTPEEQAEWAAWKVEHDKAHELKQAEEALSAVVRTLVVATKAVQAGVTPPPQAQLWPAIDSFLSALNKAGHERPKRPRGRPKLEDQKS